MAITSIAEATAAPREVTLSGKIYYISPLVDEDIGEFERWVSDQFIDLAKRHLDGLSDVQTNALLTHAYDVARKITMTSPESLELMITPRGCSKLFWLSFRHRHPELTEEQVMGLLTDPKNFTAISNKIDALRNSSQPLKKRVIRKKVKRKKRN